jgi:hypothetical protein
MPNTDQQTALYVSEMSAELAKLAIAVENPTLATLLRLAAKIAKQHAVQDGEVNVRSQASVTVSDTQSQNIG